VNTLRRILQLTILAIVFMVVGGVAFFFIELWSGGRLERWRSAPFTGSVGDESLAIELATLPVVLAVLACWGVVRLFRLRAVHNEVDDTFRPILTVISGYGRFVLIVVAAAYLLMGYGWAAAAHFAIAVVMFALFYRHHRVREQAIHDRLQLEQEEEGDDNPRHVA
jgi:hypothetical protein